MLGFDRKNSEALDLNMDTPNEVDAEENKANGIGRTCSDCQTTKTPLWRGGPKGPKSLCNACGIRYRKKRRALLGLNKGGDEKKEKETANSVFLSNLNCLSLDEMAFYSDHYHKNRGNCVRKKKLQFY